MLLGLGAIVGAHAAAPATDMRAEADSFLQAMAPGLQRRQTAAIRAAIAGDGSQLLAVRNSRNVAPQLPDGVTRRDVGPGLALFRSSRFDGQTLPLLIYLHGGGWTFGSINSCSRFCAAMAVEGIAVLAVDYRLAPENPFPTGLEDCLAAVRTAMENIDEWNCNGISIGGDSSGGNLAIATILSLPPSTFDTLVTFYPVTKAYADGSDSWREFGLGYGLDAEIMEAFNDAYISDCHNPLVSPAEASDSLLRRLPRTLIVGAERDILRCQGREFAERLQALGIDADYHMLPGTVHLFITVPGQPSAFRKAVALAAASILSN